MWVFMALGAAVLTSFNPILYKRILKDADPITVVWIIVLLALPLLCLFAVVLTPQIPTIDWIFVLGVLGSAGLNVAAHLASTNALKLEDVSRVTPLLTLSPIFTLLIAAVFLGEMPSLRGLAGIGLVLSGAYWLNYDSGTGMTKPFQLLAFKSGVALMLSAGLLWAITPMFEKIAIQHTQPQSPRLVAFLVSASLALMLTPAVIARGRSAIRKVIIYRHDLILATLIASIAPMLAYTAYALGLVGYVTTLFKLSAVMTVLWSRLFLHEYGLALRLPASLVMVIGAILIAT
jgi:drug/metabolite transporter (DMT)-like permease